MRVFPILIGATLATTGCNEAAETHPPLDDTKNAVLAYANCLNDEARSLVAKDIPVDSVAEQSLGACKSLRTKALELEAVPIIAENEAEFDKMHSGLAKGLITTLREKEADAIK